MCDATNDEGRALWGKEADTADLSEYKQASGTEGLAARSVRSVRSVRFAMCIVRMKKLTFTPSHRCDPLDDRCGTSTRDIQARLGDLGQTTRRREDHLYLHCGGLDAVPWSRRTRRVDERHAAPFGQGGVNYLEVGRGEGGAFE